MSYISQGNRPSGCVLCDLSHDEVGEGSLVLWRGEKVFVVLNRYPYVSGHLMVVPARHVGDCLAVPLDEWDAAWRMVLASVAALSEVYRPHGFNIGMNLGRAAGAGIEGHIHIHVVPRWDGDNNFVSVVSETRVIPEALEVTWRRLRPCFQRLEGVT